MLFSRVAILITCSVLAADTKAEDARTLLSTTLAKYANPATYYAEGTQESTITDDTERSWQQEVFLVAKGADKQHHYELKASDQWNISVADGSLEWIFQPWRNEYTRRTISKEPDENGGKPEDTLQHFLARAAQTEIEDLSQFRVGRAEFLPDENLTFGGQQVRCYVIRATYDPGEHDPAPERNPPEYTFWIEKDRRLIRKKRILSHNSDSMLQPLRHVEHTYTTTYKTIQLNATLPARLFTFIPPATAKQVPRLFLNMQHIDLTGLPAPPLPLTTLDGKSFDPSSLRGHTVIVDFWASWCVPCIQEMRSLSKLLEAGPDSNLVVIGVNLYETPIEGMEFLKKHHYTWTNLRGDNQTTATAWMLNGVPLVAIVDPHGILAYYHSGYQKPEEAVIFETLRRVDPRLKALVVPCDNAAESE